MKQELDPKLVAVALVGILVIAGGLLWFKIAGPGRTIPASEDTTAMSEQYQNDLNNRGGGGSEAEMRNQTPPQ